MRRDELILQPSAEGEFCYLTRKVDTSQCLEQSIRIETWEGFEPINLLGSFKNPIQVEKKVTTGPRPGWLGKNQRHTKNKKKRRKGERGGLKNPEKSKKCLEQKKSLWHRLTGRELTITLERGSGPFPSDMNQVTLRRARTIWNSPIMSYHYKIFYEGEGTGPHRREYRCGSRNEPKKSRCRRGDGHKSN